MSNTRYYLVAMTVYLGIVCAVCAVLYKPLQHAFMANWGFNLLILSSLVAGAVINYRQVLKLEPEIHWIKMFRTGRMGISVADSPALLRPLARHLSGINRDRFSMSALSLRTVLEGIRGRLDDSTEVSRYMINLLIFLGLLGTFWGLLKTIGAVGAVIGGMDVGNGDFVAVFEKLKAGLMEPLSGMGTAFSSSLFGLGGSLVLGFLDMQANHAQNRFFNELEEWLSGVTQLVEPGKTELEEHQEASAEAGMENLLKTVVREVRKNNRTMEKMLGEQETGEPEPSRPASVSKEK